MKATTDFESSHSSQKISHTSMSKIMSHDPFKPFILHCNSKQEKERRDIVARIHE
jgi:hypothetical protein